MDPITTTVAAAIASGAAAGVTEVGKKAVVDLYKRLKDLIKSKFGQENKTSQAIAKPETDHGSEGRQMVLAEQMALQKAAKDPDIVNLATKLIQALEQTDGGNSGFESRRTAGP